MNEFRTIPVNINDVISEKLNVSKQISSQETSSKIISGFEKSWWHLRIRLSLLTMIFKTYNLLYGISALKYLIHLRKKFLGNFKLKKMARVDGKFYMGLFTPGWNDKNYERFIQSELHHFKPNKGDSLRFNHVYVAITKKCALQCDHCYAWDVLNQKDQLSEEDLRCIIDKLQSLGTGQIHLTGGEPLIKPDLLLKLLEGSKNNSNFWINTSGFKLTNEVAKRLKRSGLTGVFISLDHFEAEKHNDFRKFKDAYYWATTGAKNAIANKLVVALSLCVTNQFVTNNNLMTWQKNWVCNLFSFWNLKK